MSMIPTPSPSSSACAASPPAAAAASAFAASASRFCASESSCFKRSISFDVAIERWTAARARSGASRRSERWASIARRELLVGMSVQDERVDADYEVRGRARFRSP